MTMLLYKFGLRIGALAKIKVSDLLDNGIILFSKTAKTDYDRIIVLHEKSIIKFMFKPDISREPNLYILKVVDKNNEINIGFNKKKYR